MEAYVGFPLLSLRQHREVVPSEERCSDVLLPQTACAAHIREPVLAALLVLIEDLFWPHPAPLQVVEVWSDYEVDDSHWSS